MSIRGDKRLIVLAAIAAVTIAVLVAIGAVLISDAQSSPSAPSGFEHAQAYPGTPPAPRMKLSDGATGREFDTADLRGRPYAVTFVYTHCHEACPLIGSELHQALAALGPAAKQTAVVAVTVDPHGDTPSAVRHWLRIHHEPANFHYLIGTEGQLKPYWNAWHVGPQIVGDPESAHTAAIYLVGGSGKIEAIVNAGNQIPIPALTHDFRTLIAQAGGDA